MLRPHPWMPAALLACALISLEGQAAESRPAQDPAVRTSVLLITADDLNYDSLGVTGSRTPDITPHIDRLASQGMRFAHAHVTIAVCQPCRSVWMTGRYPHRNAAEGFEPINPDVPTLGESFRAAGYLNGIMAKVGHLEPRAKHCWDVVVEPDQLGQGRAPDLYYEHARTFFEKAKGEGKPFFLMANSQDPHRPFAGSAQQRRRGGDRADPQHPELSRTYRPEEVEVPCFLPDLPDVRREIAQYYTSVHRCDETVGRLLKALDDAGLAENTLVMFLSDHGMPLPFAKTNCYLTSTRTPWIVRWPGRVRPGAVDTRHMVSGIDLMPTLLDALGLPPVDGVDGRSMLPLLDGKAQEGRDRVFTTFHCTSGRNDYPMRSVQDRRFGYIFNPWSDGSREFRNESQSGLTMNAMRAGAKTDEAVAARVKLFLYRVPEEFYDYEADPCALNNLIDDPQHRERISAFRGELLGWMAAVKDPLLETFHARIGDASASLYREQFLTLCDLATEELTKKITPFVARDDASTETHHMPFFEDAHAVRALAVAYDMTGKRAYLDACRKWSDHIIDCQNRMIPAGAYFMNHSRAPGQDQGQWNVADSSSIGMGVLATAMRCEKPDDRERYLDSVKRFARLVMDNYVGTDGGISNGLWPQYADSWWCSSATFGTLAFQLHDATGDEGYFQVGKGAVKWMTRRHFRDVKPITFEQRPSGIIFYCFELYAAGLGHLQPDSEARHAAMHEIKQALEWMGANQRTRGADVPHYLERNTDMSALPFLMYAFAREIPGHRDERGAADRELSYIGHLLLRKGRPETSRLMTWEVLSWGLLSFTERVQPGALFRAAPLAERSDKAPR